MLRRAWGDYAAPYRKRAALDQRALTATLNALQRSASNMTSSADLHMLSAETLLLLSFGVREENGGYAPLPKSKEAQYLARALEEVNATLSILHENAEAHWLRGLIVASIGSQSVRTPTPMLALILTLNVNARCE